MAASKIGNLRAKLGLDGAEFTAGLRKADSGLQRFAANAGKLAAGAAATMKTAMVAMGVSAVETAAEIDRMSQLANTAPDQFQRWAAGAKAVGIEQDKLADILKDMNDRVGDFVQTGGGPMKDFFENIAPKVGVTADAFRGLSGADALQLYVSSLEKANLGQQDMTFYMEALASDSTALLPLLKDGGKAMAEYAKRAEDMGAIMSGDMLASLREGKSALAEMNLAVDGMRNTIGAMAVPAIKALAAAVAAAAMFFHTHADTIGTVLQTLAGTAAVVAAAFAAKYAVAIGTTAVRAMIAAVTQSVALELALGAQSRAAALASVAVKGLSFSLQALKVALVQTGIGAVVVAAGYMVGKFLELVSASGSWGEALGLLGEVARAVWGAIVKSADAIPPGLNAVWNLIKADFHGLVGDLQYSWYGFLSTMASGARSVKLDGLADRLAEGARNAGAAWDETFAKEGAARAAATASAGQAAATITEAFAPVADAWGKLRDTIKGTSSDIQSMPADAASAGIAADSGSAEKAAAAAKKAKEETDKLKDSADRGKDALEGLFGSLLEGADSAKQAVANLLMQIAQVQFAQAALGLIGQTSWGSGLVKGLGSLIGKNANGTPNWQGNLTSINERGGEIINLPKGSQVIPHDISQRMADRAASAPGGHVSIGFDENTGSFTAAMYDVAGNVVATATPSIQRGAVQQTVRANRKSKSLFR